MGFPQIKGTSQGVPVLRLFSLGPSHLLPLSRDLKQAP